VRKIRRIKEGSIALFEDRGVQKIRTSAIDFEKGIGFGGIRPLKKRDW